MSSALQFCPSINCAHRLVVAASNVEGIRWAGSPADRCMLCLIISMMVQEVKPLRRCFPGQCTRYGTDKNSCYSHKCRCYVTVSSANVETECRSSILPALAHEVMLRALIKALFKFFNKCQPCMSEWTRQGAPSILLAAVRHQNFCRVARDTIFWPSTSFAHRDTAVLTHRSMLVFRLLTRYQQCHPDELTLDS